MLESFLIKFQTLSSATLLNRDSNTGILLLISPVNIAKFLRTAFFIEHLWWLLLQLPLVMLQLAIQMELVLTGGRL